MELRVFDKTVQPLGAIDELASLLWHTKYFDVGTFSLLAPIKAAYCFRFESKGKER